ncbi:MAG: hypothetical protein M1282_07890 [Chloroflexi bacterium]|nr:hypothetical protein [Chloroflexota bacterium]
MNKIKNIARIWLPFAVVTSAFCGLAYLLVQQSMRMGLNDPQIQMAEDTALALNNGATVDSVIAGQKVEISASLAPFIVVYDTSGKAVSGSGLLNGQLPDYPIGVLDAAKQSGENRVTWQPNSNVRIASVSVPYKDGFVIAGRNMREVENRESNVELIAFLVWLATLIATFIVIAFGEIFLAENK